MYVYMCIYTCTCTYHLPNCYTSELLVIKLTQCFWTLDLRGNDKQYSEQTQVSLNYSVLWLITLILFIYMQTFESTSFSFPFFKKKEWAHWEQDRCLLDYFITWHSIVSFFISLALKKNISIEYFIQIWYQQNVL